MIRKASDIVLNVRPLLIGCEHLFYYEGPCRFGSGETLEPGYDRLANGQMHALFLQKLSECAGDGINIMEPVHFGRTDDWDCSELQWDDMAAKVKEADLVVAYTAIACDDIVLEFAERFRIPVAISPLSGFSGTIAVAGLKSKAINDYEVYAFYKWGDLRYKLKILRARKIIRNTHILCAPRFGSTTSYSSVDAFNSFDLITNRLGVRFRFVNAHELLDQMSPAEPGGNHTTPGRITPDITTDELDEAGRMADELIAGAQEVQIERQYLINSIVAWMTVQKLMDLKDCNGFTAPCPDVCSTRRLNEQKFTFCLTHSLNMEQGIPSSCEYDTAAVLSQQALIAVSGKCPYMGNTAPVAYEDGQLALFNRQDIPADALARMEAEPENLYYMHHSVAHRRLPDPDRDAPYAVRHFAYDQGFGATLRYDFNADAGKRMTMCRFSPDGSKLFICGAEIVAGSGYDKFNCTQKVFFRVNDQEDAYEKQCLAGNHCVMVYGDYVKELTDLAKALGIEPVTAK